jgi:hypothetical protein
VFQLQYTYVDAYTESSHKYREFMNTLYKGENVYSVGVHISCCIYRIQHGRYKYREFLDTLYKGENVASSFSTRTLMHIRIPTQTLRIQVINGRLV